jgi:hypothetical protein
MKASERDRLLKPYNELRDALSVSVKIDHGEILKIVVKDLANKRNAACCKIRDSFDQVLKTYYLSDDEFQKYVVEEKELP